MTAIRLPKLPDRTTIKLVIQILPDLQQRLSDYAEFYRTNYGVDEPVAELVPAMLSAFMDGDRGFLRRPGVSSS